MRYLLGAIIGAIGAFIIMYSARYNDLIKYEKSIVNAIERNYYGGCLKGYNVATGNVGIPMEHIGACKMETDEYMETMREIWSMGNE